MFNSAHQPWFASSYSVRFVGVMSAAMTIVSIGGLPGCGSPFLHTASTSDQAISDPRLIGEWTTDDEHPTRARIMEPQPTRYVLELTVHHEKDPPTRLALDLTLTRIGNDQYADLFLSREERDRLVKNYGFLVVPVHQVMKIAPGVEEMQVWSFDGSWLEQTAKRGGWTHDRVALGGGESVMIAGSTSQVRELIRKHGEDPRAFGEPIVFRRVVN